MIFEEFVLYNVILGIMTYAFYKVTFFPHKALLGLISLLLVMTAMGSIGNVSYTFGPPTNQSSEVLSTITTNNGTIANETTTSFSYSSFTLDRKWFWWPYLAWLGFIMVEMGRAGSIIYMHRRNRG